MNKIYDDDPDWEVNKMSNNVEHPQHYNREGALECIDEMILVFGKEAVKNFCLCNSWKYRYRAADKNGLEDLKKSDWYMNKYKELCEENKPTITVSRPDVITIPYTDNIIPTATPLNKQFYVDYNDPFATYTTTATVNT